MEIKNLVKRINDFKQLRNSIEIEYDAFVTEGRKASTDAQAEIEMQDRAGLPHRHTYNQLYWEELNKGLNQLEYGIKYINEGIGILEASYRRAVRFKEPEEIREDKTSDK